MAADCIGSQARSLAVAPQSAALADAIPVQACAETLSWKTILGSVWGFFLPDGLALRTIQVELGDVKLRLLHVKVDFLQGEEVFVTIVAAFLRFKANFEFLPCGS